MGAMGRGTHQGPGPGPGSPWLVRCTCVSEHCARVHVHTFRVCVYACVCTCTRVGRALLAAVWSWALSFSFLISNEGGDRGPHKRQVPDNHSLQEGSRHWGLGSQGPQSQRQSTLLDMYTHPLVSTRDISMTRSYA